MLLLREDENEEGEEKYSPGDDDFDQEFQDM